MKQLGYERGLLMVADLSKVHIVIGKVTWINFISYRRAFGIIIFPVGILKLLWNSTGILCSFYCVSLNWSPPFCSHSSPNIPLSHAALRSLI
ncbi:hypothetical protein GDO78_012933 [Eleutherodactylus coqui]|uniref:Uncharacterized protein n=1 Tax=Eleutherodactylus coqui TaxID=57060 RepID=A0A8J6EYD4_ELECQ|nr:hypothetical protein GDO78_012933 [Eleutherodactylus coqui]